MAGMIFDYQKFLRAYWEKRMYCPLTSCEADMYMYLLKECELGNWAISFKLPTKKCELELDFSRKTICAVRNALSQKGYIKYKPSKFRGDVAEYEIVGLSVFLTVTQEVTQMETQMETQKVTQEVTQMETQKVTQTKEKERKDKEESSPAPPKEEKENKEKESVLPDRCGKSAAVKKLHTECRTFFEGFVNEKYSSVYYWTAKDAGQLKQLLNAIKFTRINHTNNGSVVPLPVDDESLAFAFKAFVEYAYLNGGDWLRKNFNVSMLNSQYNTIKQKGKTNYGNGNLRKESGVPVYESNDDYDKGFSASAV